MATVAEILLARGEQDANRRRRQGEISGQLWRNLGDIALQAWQGYQRQQEQAPRLALDKLAVQDAQQHQAGQQVLDRAMQPYQPVGPQPEGEPTAAPQHPYLDAQTGLFDTSKLSDVIAAHGLAHLAPDLLKGVEAQNDAILKHQELQQKFSQQQAITLGTAANTTLKLMDAGLPFDQAVQHASSSLVATGLMKPEQLHGIVQQWGQLPDDQLRAQLQQVKATAARIGPTKSLGKDAKEVDMFGDTIASNVVPEKPPAPSRARFAEIMNDPASTSAQKAAAKASFDALAPPVPVESAQSVDKLLDGKPATLMFDPKTKQYTDASGNVIENASTRIKPIPSQASVNITQGESDAKAIADSIIAGQQPPDVKGLFRLAGPVRAELAKQGYDMTTANLDWEATKKHLATLNGAQQTRLRQAISTASDSLDVIQNLADKWDAGRFPILNKANLALAKNGVYGKDAASIATQLEGQITDVTSELGNVYMGGNSPTDHALKLAGKNLDANWDRKVLTDMIALARKNLQIRNNSIINSGAVTMSSQSSAPKTPAVKDPLGIR